MDLKGTGYEGADWIHLAQDIVQWRALVNMVTNLLNSYKEGICLPS